MADSRPGVLRRLIFYRRMFMSLSESHRVTARRCGEKNINYYINLYSPRKCSDTKNAAIYEHKYKQNESNDQVYQKFKSIDAM